MEEMEELDTVDMVLGDRDRERGRLVGVLEPAGVRLSRGQLKGGGMLRGGALL